MGRLPGNAVQRNAGRSELGGGETPLRLREQRLQRRLRPLQAGARSDAVSMMLPAQRASRRVKHTPLKHIAERRSRVSPGRVGTDEQGGLRRPRVPEWGSGHDLC